MDHETKENVSELSLKPSNKQGTLVEALNPLVQEYLTEIKSPLSIAAYLKELSISPIFLDGELVGFWGLQLRQTIGNRKLATMKAFYIRRQFRGRFRDRVADDLIRGLERLGVTDLEIWAFPEIQRWLEKRYDIKPNIYVTYNSIDKFKVYEEK